MDAWLAAGLGFWVGGVAGFMLAAVLAAASEDDPPAEPNRGGYPSQGPPITVLPPVPAGPAPGARRDDSAQVCVAGMGPRCGCRGCHAARLRGEASW